MVHLPTYLNKMTIGFEDGTLELWDCIRGMGLISSHNYQSTKKASTSTFGISCLLETSALDVVAIGYKSGLIHLVNCKTKQILLQFQQEGEVSTFALRNDDFPILVSASSTGDCSFWHLQRREHLFTMKNLHSNNSRIIASKFLPKQSLLLTCGSDNKLCLSLMETENTEPRLLSNRSGHYGPVSTICFYGDKEGKIILSGGALDNQFRSFSVTKDQQAIEWSQKRAKNLNRKASLYDVALEDLKLPSVTQISSSILKETEWDTILTCHKDCNYAITWNYENKIAGAHKLKSTDNETVVRCFVSNSSHFGVIGSCKGTIDLFSMQSGNKRRTIRHSTDDTLITGLAIDQTDSKIISTGMDGSLKIWDLYNRGELLMSFSLENNQSILSMAYNQENGMFALASSDGHIYILMAIILQLLES